jgi:hypothetical protein
MTRREAFRTLLGAVEEKELDWVLSTAAAMHKRLVSKENQRAARDLLRDAARLFGSSSSLAAQSRLRNFLQSAGPVSPIKVVPYVVSASRDILCGCALEDLIVIGVHPNASAPQILGVVIHEAIHLSLNYFPYPPAFEASASQTLDEALATALGSAWFVEQITGKAPAAPWYDDTGIDALAKLLYPRIIKALQAGERLDSLLPELIAEAESY